MRALRIGRLRMVTCGLALALATPVGAKNFETATHRFEEVAPGVYFAVGTGRVFVQSNSMVVVNDQDVLVVDSHVTGEAAQALLDSIRELTPKPVTYLVNTHYHFDHAHGNQAFPPGVNIVGHEFTREKLLGDLRSDPTLAAFTRGIPAAIAGMKAAAAAETDSEKRRALEAQVRVQEAHLEALGEVRRVPPDVTLRRKLSIHRGTRSIELHFFGRGHTGGDVIAYLPKEKIVFTGDLLLPFPAYMGDGYVDEWPATLEQLKGLDFDTILPGHGEAFRDRSLIDRFQSVLRQLWAAAREQRRKGASVAEAVEGIDFDSIFSVYESNPLASLGPELQRAILTLQLQRMYERMDEL